MSKLLAPNGKPSRLNSKQYKLVRTSAFKKWFGDWEKDPENASKVIDSNGEPLIVFHGSPTGKRFNSFKSKYNLFFFASEKNVAKNQYSSMSSDGLFLKDSRVFDVFLNIRNPYRIDAENREYCDINQDFDNENYEILEDLAYSVKNYQIEDDEEENENETPVYDGLIAKRVDEEQMFGAYGKTAITDVYVSFSPNQIKIADGTNTTFDNNNVDIRFDDGGVVVGENEDDNKLPTKEEAFELIQDSIESQGTYFIDEDGDGRFESKEQAQEYVDEIYDFFYNYYSLGMIPIYRVVKTDEVDLDPYSIGESWSLDLDNAKSFGSHLGGSSKELKIISGYVPNNNVDWESAFRLFPLFSDFGDGDSEFELPVPSNNKLINIKVSDYKDAKELEPFSDENNLNIRFHNGGEVYLDDLSEKSKEIIESNYNGSFGFYDFDWNKESERENFGEWLKDFKENQFKKNLSKVIKQVESDIKLKNEQEKSEIKLKYFEELIIPSLGNEVLIPKLSIYEKQVLLDPNATIDSIQKGFIDAKNIIDEDGSINQSKITPSNLIEDDTINLPAFEKFVEKNPQYKGVFNDWKKIFDENMNISLKETYAFRYPSLKDLEYLHSELVEFKNKKIKDKFNTGGEVGTGLFSQIWDWFGIKF